MKSLFSWNFLQKLTKKRGIVPLAPTISPTTSMEGCCSCASNLTVGSVTFNPSECFDEVYEEVGCISDGSTRRADIIIIDRQKDKGVILDPTIRFEMHEQQPQEMRGPKSEEWKAYDGSVQDLKVNDTLNFCSWLSVGVAVVHIQMLSTCGKDNSCPRRCVKPT
ncbi:hypothetical protein ANN_25274 [Periplaneta americana]|uniref:Uncharacterized protein n=1 Tax=Periplaneta americana TaxID=6978 RepID=A0ABQ8S1F1_PERAM|nr:hypothetical protein ANN_25274 [Periplaneta americana]